MIVVGPSIKIFPVLKVKSPSSSNVALEKHAIEVSSVKVRVPKLSPKPFITMSVTKSVEAVSIMTSPPPLKSKTFPFPFKFCVPQNVNVPENIVFALNVTSVASCHTIVLVIENSLPPKPS